MNLQSTILAIVIGAIALGAAIFANNWINNTKVNNDMTYLTSLKGSTTQHAATNGGNFTGMTTAIAAGLGFFPAQTVTTSGSTTTVLNQYKGNITVAPATVTNTNDALTFTWTGIPSAICSALAQQAANLVATMSIGGTQVKANGAALQQATAQTQCTNAADNASMDFTFSR